MKKSAKQLFILHAYEYEIERRIVYKIKISDDKIFVIYRQIFFLIKCIKDNPLHNFLFF